jgi:hypothetical protein
VIGEVEGAEPIAADDAGGALTGAGERDGEADTMPLTRTGPTPKGRSS